MRRSLRLSLFVLAAALPASCGGSVGSGPDVDQAGMPGRDGTHAGDSAVAGGTTGTGGTTSTGGTTAKAGSGSGLGGTGGGGEDGNAFSGNMAGGAGPPVYACEARDVARKPTSAGTLPFRDAEPKRVFGDAQGNLYVAGTIGHSQYLKPDFGGGPLLNEGDLFLVKLDASGQHVWSTRFGSSGNDVNDRLASLSLSSDGNIVLGVEVDASLNSQEHRFAAMRFDAAGQLLQTFTFEVPSEARLAEVWSVDAELFFAFALGAELTVVDTTFPGPEQPGSAWPPYVLRFDDEGELIYSVRWPLGEELGDVVADADGNSYLLTSKAVNLTRSSSVLSLSRSLETRWQFNLPGRTATHLALGNAQLVIGGIEVQSGGPLNRQDQIFLQRVNVNSGAAAMTAHAVPLHGQAGPSSVHTMLVLPDDSVVLGGEGRAGWTIGDTRFKSASDWAPFLMQISDVGEPLWATLFCVSSDHEGRVLPSPAYIDGTLRALVEHGDQLEVGLSQPLGSAGGTELLTFDLDPIPEGEP